MKLTLSIATLSALFSYTVQAQPQYLVDTSLVAPLDEWQLAVSAGYGKIANPVFEQSDVPFYLLPDIRYYSDKFSLENLNLSYNIFENNHLVIELIGQQNLDGLYFPGKNRKVVAAFTGNDSKGRLFPFKAPTVFQPPKVQHKSLSYMAGGELRYYGDVMVRVGAVHDISNVHHGFELQASANKMWSFSSWIVELELGAVYKDKHMTNYYYGYQAPSDVVVNNFLLQTPSYQASSAINYTAQVGLTYVITPKWYLVNTIKNEWLDASISNSPLIVKNNIRSYFVGIKHIF
ncbi:MipA/OmpV family protein [Thalassotalea sp. PLHSN55]|uniref:MipA/OmpV family protein n=1 Tax=Thalassotalea sp. PLHSN55 TaxID=3435888 RepID=UPI003F82AE67